MYTFSFFVLILFLCWSDGGGGGGGGAAGWDKVVVHSDTYYILNEHLALKKRLGPINTFLKQRSIMNILSEIIVVSELGER